MSNEESPFRGAGFTVTQRSLNLSLLSSDLAVRDFNLSSIVLSLQYSFDRATYSLFPYLHRDVLPPYSPSVSSTDSFDFVYDIPEMPKPERGTPEYAAYKQAKKDRKERKELKPSSAGGLTVERPVSRAGSEFSFISNKGGSDDEGNTSRSVDKKGEDRGLTAFVQGYVGAGAQFGGGGAAGYHTSYSENSGAEYGHGHSTTAHYSPVSDFSSESGAGGKPYMVPQYNYPPASSGQAMIPPPPPSQYPPSAAPSPSPGVYSPQPQSSQQYGAQLAPFGAGYGYPPPSQGSGYVAPLPPPSPGPYTQAASAAVIQPPPPLDPKYGPPIPGFGAGVGQYPPGETPTQYINPDYYGDITAASAAASTSNHQHTGSSSSINVNYTTQPSYSPIPSTGKVDSSGNVYQVPPPPPSSQYQPGHSSSGSVSLIPPPPHLSVTSSSGGDSYTSTALSSLAIPGMAGLSLSSSTLGPGGLPPPSPSLQPYFGTYQSISPLPSPVLSPSGGSSFYSSTSTVTTTTSTTGGGYGSDGSFSIGPSSHPSHGIQVTPVIPSRPPSPPYDPSADAKELLSSLKHFRPSAAPLIQILPTLSPSQIVLLRREYKRIFRQVNIAKHIKTVFANTSFGKLAFAVALGPYESEAWFANCWYQKRETRNELLIEALMGKTNDEIRKIKDGFKDAKYENSLMQAVRNELVANKFRIAVLIQLEGMRMEESARINLDGVRDDVRRLGEVLERKDGRGGGETMMIEIIVNRSDAWIREVAALYRNTHGRDLPKAIMRHSKNLVGETLLHVINGAIDKPLRDAKLMEQALSALIESGREDLLISRCVRVHWDPYHLERVKQAYKKKFKVDLGKRMRDAVEDGNFEDFLVRMIRD